MAGGMTKEQTTEPLHTLVVAPHANINRAHALVYACSILALFYHRSLHLIHSNHLLSFFLFLLMLLAEMVLAIMWAMHALGFRWRPARRQEFPQRLSQVINHDRDLPAMDVFICTADPFKEPPLNVVNTALSVMAFEYPPDKISVYVSDDGGSNLTLFAFAEAAKFARHWLPYCRENKVAVRCPEVHLQSACSESAEKIRDLYESMKDKIDRVLERGHLLDSDHDHPEAFKKWTAGFTRQDHPTIIEVLLGSSKDMDASGHPLPNLVYVSREKNRCFPHHFKAGALNVLLRVSGTMTNAPVVLTLDCDMFSNDPQAPRRAMCYLLDPAKAPKLAYVQFPQRFRGVNKNDIYGSEWRRLFFINPMGMDGLVGTTYVGTGCFFNRRALYGGPSPSQPILMPPSPSSVSISIQSESVLQTAHEVASCSYEQGTEWGSKMGMRYGSLVEDFYTGYKLHCEGWESVFCNPEKAAFLGDVPINLNDVLSQTKRWCVGLLEVFYSQFSPATFGASRLPASVAFCYTHHSLWSAWSVPLTIYAFLPQLALLAQIPLFPKISNTWCFLYLYLFIAANLQDLAEFLITGGTTRRWWNDQRIWMMRGLTSYLFSLIEFLLKHMGISTAGFTVTNKVVDDDQSKRYEQGSFEFGVHSPMFVTLSTAAMINLIAFLVGILRSATEGKVEEMCMQLLISGFVVLNAWPIYKGMVRRDEGRVPARTTIVSVLLSWALCYVAYFSNL